MPHFPSGNWQKELVYSSNIPNSSTCYFYYILSAAAWFNANANNKSFIVNSGCGIQLDKYTDVFLQVSSLRLSALLFCFIITFVSDLILISCSPAAEAETWVHVWATAAEKCGHLWAPVIGLMFDLKERNESDLNQKVIIVDLHVKLWSWKASADVQLFYLNDHVKQTCCRKRKQRIMAEVLVRKQL